MSEPKRRFVVRVKPPEAHALSPTPAVTKAPPTPKKPTFAERLAAQNRRLVNFIVPLDLWTAFIETVPPGKKPNDLFVAWLKGQVKP